MRPEDSNNFTDKGEKEIAAASLMSNATSRPKQERSWEREFVRHSSKRKVFSTDISVRKL